MGVLFFFGLQNRSINLIPDILIYLK